MALEAAGLGSEQERAYRMLVRLGDAPAAQLAEVLGVGEVVLKELLADLQELADAAVLTVEYKVNLLRPAQASGYRVLGSVTSRDAP